MFDRIFDLLAQAGELFRFWVVVPQYDGGVILRFGKYHRDIGPGLHFKWFGFEDDITTNTSLTTMELRPQTLTTNEGHSVVVSAVIKYRIKNPKLYLLEVWDARDVLKDVTMAAIREQVTAADFTVLVGDKEVEAKVLESVRQQCNRYGFKVERITFADLGRIRTIRLMGDPPEDN